MVLQGSTQALRHLYIQVYKASQRHINSVSMSVASQRSCLARRPRSYVSFIYIHTLIFDINQSQDCLQNVMCMHFLLIKFGTRLDSFGNATGRIITLHEKWSQFSAKLMGDQASVICSKIGVCFMNMPGKREIQKSVVLCSSKFYY